MDANLWGFIGAVIGTLVGATASIVTTVINAKSTYKLQAQANSDSRLDRARDFHRSNLLELQEILSDHMRLIAKAHLAHAAFLDQYPNAPEEFRLSDELDESIRLANRKLSIRIERVADNTLREKIKAVRSVSNSVSDAKSADESYLMFQKAGEAYQEMETVLGAVLRSYY